MTDHAEHNYVKIWGILLALLVVSILGPLLGIRFVTLITAFGIAIVKAYLVAKHFMHVNIEKRWVAYTLLAMLAFMVVMFSGIAPDVMLHEGAGWENTAAKEVVEAGMESAASSEEGH